MTFARVRALIFVAVLFVAAGIVVLTTIGKDSQAHVSAVDQCPSGSVPAHTRMPERNQVSLNVLNGTKTSQLAQQIATDFKFRGFNVKKTGDAPKPVTGIAVITFGPDAVGAAYLVSAYFLAEATMNFELQRKGADVDVTIGPQFEQLATQTEVNQSIAEIGNPPLPPGTCNAPGNVA